MNQNIVISKIEEKLKEACMNYRTNRVITAIIKGDFKMKFEPLSSRESTLDHYSKRGISWHGFCLIFYFRQLVSNNNGTVTSKEAIKYTVNLNQILSDSNKQDSLSVLSLDTTMAQIRLELYHSLINSSYKHIMPSHIVTIFCYVEYHY